MRRGRSRRWPYCAGREVSIPEVEDKDWQRLDKWLWCARFLRARGDCAGLAAGGFIRINRQATDKAHARVRIGDVLTVPLRGDVRVVRVLSLAARRGPAPEARRLYEELTEARPDNPGQDATGEGSSRAEA